MPLYLGIMSGTSLDGLDIALLKQDARAELIDALDALTHRTRDQGLSADIVVQGDVEALPSGARALAYRIAREGLRNAVKHAQASRALVVIDVGREAVVVTGLCFTAGILLVLGRTYEAQCVLLELVGELCVGPRPRGCA